MRSVTLVKLLMISFMMSGPAALAKEQPSAKGDRYAKRDMNKYLAALEQQLKFRQSTIADLKNRGNLDLSVEMFSEDAKLLKQQIAEAKKLIAVGKEFGKVQYDAMAKERKRASAERLARRHETTRQEIEKGRDAAAAERQAAIEKATGRYAEAQRRAVEQYESVVGPAELLRKFRTSNGELRLVIWNLPLEREMHKRFTRSVNVTLMSGKEVAWKRNGLKLNPRQPATEIELPQVLFDRVNVDLVQGSGEGGGLSEIQAFVGAENIALGRPCEVTGIETTPAHLDDENAVTDGVTTPTEIGVGYWIPEAKQKASVSIDLLGKPHTMETAEPENDPINALDRPNR